MAGVRLSNGVIQAILRGDRPEKPILQVMSMKKIQSDNASADRYRLLMSDGQFHQPCMMATQMNELIHSGRLTKHCIVEVDKYLCNTIHERKIIILVSMTVLQSGAEVGNTIGNPQQLELMRIGQNCQPPAPQQNVPPPPGGNRGGGRYGGSYGGSGGAQNGMQAGGNYPQPRFGGGGPGSGMNRPTTTMGGPPKPYGSAAPPPPTRPGVGSPLSQRGIFPITSLSPYQNKWTIRARAQKPSIRTWSNSRGEGRVMNIDLMDETGEIRAFAFNEMADKFYPVFEMGKVYYISRGRLKPANKQYSSVKNDYELNLTEETDVELCLDNPQGVPSMQFHFTPIADIETAEVNSIIDVIGVCKNPGELATVITRSTSRKLSKRDIQLVDRSGKVVNLTLWGAEAEGFDGSKSPVIAIKGCKVSDFGGRSLSTQFSSVTMIDPDIPEAHQLRGWFDNVGKNEEATSISDQRGGGGGQPSAFLTLAQVKELNLGQKEKPDFFSCKATVTFSKKDNCLYKACPSADCNKKVTETGGGQYHCEKCNQTFPDFKYRIILAINVADYSGSQWLTCFAESAVEVVGKSAQELGELREQDEAAFDQVFQQANFKDYIFRVRAKMDTFNDEQRLKCYCAGVAPVNYAQEAKRRLEDIKQIMAQ